MHYFGYFILVSPFLIRNAYTEVMPVEPLCSEQHSPHTKRCCTDHRTIGKKCYPCNGSFGIECSKPCPEGYYGVKCGEKCPCERCNAKTGYCNSGTEGKYNVSSEQENGNTSGSLTWIPILLGLLGSMGSLALLFLALYVKERKNFVQSEKDVEVSTREENTNNECDQDDYDSIRESRLMLDDDDACGGQKKIKTLDRISYAKTQTLQNPYNKLSFNRLKSRTMDFRNGELYNVSETGSLRMDIGDYVTVASENAKTEPLSLKDSEGEDNESYNNYYSDVANRQPNKELCCGKMRQNTNVSEKKVKDISKLQNKKPTIKPKPTHLVKPTKVPTKEQREDRLYSVANQSD